MTGLINRRANASIIFSREYLNGRNSTNGKEYMEEKKVVD